MARKNPHAVALGRKAKELMTPAHRKARAKKAAAARWNPTKIADKAWRASSPRAITSQLSTDADDVDQARSDLLRAYKQYAPECWKELAACKLFEERHDWARRWGLTRNGEPPSWVLDPSALKKARWSGVPPESRLIEFPKYEWHPGFLEDRGAFRKTVMDQFGQIFDRRLSEIEAQYRTSGVADGLRPPQLILWRYFRPAVLFQTMKDPVEDEQRDFAQWIADQCQISRTQVYRAHRDVFEKVGLTRRRLRPGNSARPAYVPAP